MIFKQCARLPKMYNETFLAAYMYYACIAISRHVSLVRSHLLYEWLVPSQEELDLDKEFSSSLLKGGRIRKCK